eukprot:CAMPEP_0113821542 /NCGR_PEP_ID=MMETSP0328-20130328/1791_1 /TAXON_ID=39455 /ORGANISM="Alexandrium minutum" /LENGTH=108 /DNA_ID=CAMNT_0000789475 /DNA_START=225 /DNA_END=551 /DNA_ORIENTATION=- /assembly_acc=CAM_ASM_000350
MPGDNPFADLLVCILSKRHLLEGDVLLAHKLNLLLLAIAQFTVVARDDEDIPGILREALDEGAVLECEHQVVVRNVGHTHGMASPVDQGAHLVDLFVEATCYDDSAVA